jgi:hypothetical protein
MHYYSVLGTLMASQIELSGLNRVYQQMESVRRQQVITLSIGRIEPLERIEHDFGWVTIAGSTCLLQPRKGLLIEIKRDNQIKVSISEFVNIEEISLYVLSCVIPVLAHMRGMVPIHGAMIELSGQQVLLLGGSGAGKSTTARALARVESARLLCDDLFSIQKHGDEKVMYFESRTIKLWNSSAELLDLEDQEKTQDPLRQDKMHYQIKNPTTSTILKTLTVFILDWYLGPTTIQAATKTQLFSKLLDSVQGKKIMKALGNGYQTHQLLVDVTKSATGARLLRSKNSQTALYETLSKIKETLNRGGV